MRELTTRSGRRPSQNAEELFGFIDLLRFRGVSSYLEVGARHGDTFDTVMRSLPVGSRGVAVDLGGGAWGTPRSVPALRDAVRALKADGYDARLVLGDSTKARIISTVEKVGPFGGVLIDGDHRYEGVKADWLAYGGMGEVVAFHDIVGDGQMDRLKNLIEVPRLWSELKAGHETIEFVAEGSRMGIGTVIRA